MQDQHGRKALILLTDGVDVGSDASLMDAIEAAQRADTLVYSILFADSGAYGFLPFGGPDGAGALRRISRDTGAGFFEVSKKHGIDQIFDAIQDELRSQYSIGYVSNEPVRISEWRAGLFAGPGEGVGGARRHAACGRRGGEPPVVRRPW